MTKLEKNDLPPCLIFIDREGRWFHKGAEMIRRNIIALFYQNMELDSKGRHVITRNNRRCYVEVEDTAFVVRSVGFQMGAPARLLMVIYVTGVTISISALFLKLSSHFSNTRLCFVCIRVNRYFSFSS